MLNSTFPSSNVGLTIVKVDEYMRLRETIKRSFSIKDMQKMLNEMERIPEEKREESWMQTYIIYQNCIKEYWHRQRETNRNLLAKTGTDDAAPSPSGFGKGSVYNISTPKPEPTNTR